MPACEQNDAHRVDASADAAEAEDPKKKESELKDGAWTGQVVTFKAHGKGEYRYHNGAYWRGECKAGKRQVSAAACFAALVLFGSIWCFFLLCAQ